MTSPLYSALILSLGMSVLGGCVSEPAEEPSSTGSTGPDDPSIAESSTGPGAEGTSTGPDEPDDDTSTGPTVEEECAEPVQGVACQEPGDASSAFSVMIDGQEGFEGETEQTCTLDDQVDDGTTLTLSLRCGNEGSQVEVALTTENPHIGMVLVGDGALELFYSETFFDEANMARYLVLRHADNGAPLVVAADAPEFEPPAGFDPTPLSLSVEPSDCALDWVGKFDVGVQNAALVTSFDGQTAELFGGNMVYLGSQSSYAVFAQDVERLHCIGPMGGFNYALWYVRTLAISMPEG
ncbi:MAG: hypothetical protein AAGF11_56035 [Myxococcota bacterium]